MYVSRNLREYRKRVSSGLLPKLLWCAVRSAGRRTVLLLYIYFKLEYGFIRIIQACKYYMLGLGLFYVSTLYCG